MQRPFRRTVQVATAIAVGVSASHLVHGRAARQEPRTEPAYSARSLAVLVDVVVRDRKGRPVLDLSREDFEVSEDGVRQNIGSFTLVSRGLGIGVNVRDRNPEGATTVIQPANTGRADLPPAIVALVFDALSSESLSSVQRAALQHIGHTEDRTAQLGVFAAEPGLRMLQRYTSDPSLIRSAIQRLTASGTNAKQLRDERMDQLRERQASTQTNAFDPGAVTAIASAAIAENAAQIGNAEVQRLLMRSELRLLEAFESLDRDHRGYSSTTTLLAVLESMGHLPGRKSVVFFSEGLPASPVLQAKLEHVVELANRSNITIYAVDAVGLRVLSSTEDTKREVQALGAERMRQISLPDDQTEGPLTRRMERTEDLMRYSGEAGLARVASDTGGFLTRDTNDFRSAFRRIDEDQRFHYLISYSPTNDAMDGAFRTIDVRVKRPGLSVFSRRGYRATRSATPPILSYERPALAMLDAAPLPRAFAAYARPFSFPDPTRPGLAPIVVRVETDVLRFDVDTATSMYSAQIVVVARVRDRSGAIVQKASQQYVLNGAADEVDRARRGEILFYRELDLSPGAYSVESIVYDVLAATGSARVSTLIVPAPGATRVQLSSLVLVARTEVAEAAAGPSVSPFSVSGSLLYPNVGEALAQGRAHPLEFYFVAYAEAGKTCAANIALLHNGRTIAEVERPLAIGASGRLTHVGQLPIGQLPAGTYELHVTVRDGDASETRTAFFTVV